jgi:glucosamine--fructose-6-phosphate aminotransferase (isomerizing)
MPTPTSPHTPFLLDIASQPEALRALARHCEQITADAAGLGAAQAGRIVLTGMGASHHATYPAYLRLAAAGRSVWHVETSELVHHLDGLIDDGTLLLCTSQSGRSAEILALLALLDRTGRDSTLAAIVNDRDSPLAQRADTVVDLHAGAEHAVGTRTFSNTVVTANWLAARLTDGPVDAGPVLVQAAGLKGWLADLDDVITAVTAALPAELPRSAVIVGRGPSLAVARGGALVVKEAAKVHAEGMSGGQFRHGPIELAEPGLLAIVLEGPAETADLSRRLAEDLATAGAATRWLGPSPPPGGVPALPMAPVIAGAAELLPGTVTLQVVAHALGTANGVVPGEFRHATKVTSIL